MIGLCKGGWRKGVKVIPRSISSRCDEAGKKPRYMRNGLSLSYFSMAVVKHRNPGNTEKDSFVLWFQRYTGPWCQRGSRLNHKQETKCINWELPVATKTSKPASHWHTSSSKATPPNLLKQPQELGTKYLHIWIYKAIYIQASTLRFAHAGFEV